MSGARAEVLPASRLLAYAGASLPTGFTFVLVNIYLLKFSTDVLGVAPVLMGWMLFASRLWDAAMDPLVGVLSDRTRSRFGRRRPWLLLGALPMAAGFAMIFAPPGFAEPSAVGLWLGAGLFVFCTGVTLIEVPHSALGAELSPAYHQRTRVFGFKRALFGCGALGAVAALGWMERSADPRAVARWVAWGGAALAVALVSWTAIAARERPGPVVSRVPASRAYTDVLRNPHARLLLLVFALQQLGVSALAASLPYLSEYVLGTPDWTDVYLVALFATSLVGVPAWIRIAVRRDKRACLRVSMVVVLLAIASLAAAGQGDIALVIGLASLGGLSSAGMDVLGPSLQADVIDWDELETGQRKEGSYFALWAFAQKSATALALFVTASGLQLVGFVPNAAQSETAVLGLRVLAAGVPSVFFGLGLIAFWRFSLTAQEHARIRRAIDARS